VADFNGDGKPDIAAFRHDISLTGVILQSEVRLVLSNGDGSFTPRTVFTEPGAINAVATADFNRDGKADLVITDDNGIAVLLGNGDGTFAAPIRAAFPNAATLAVGDFNGDAIPDLVVESQQQGAKVLFGNGDGSFAAPVSIPVGSTSSRFGLTSFAVGDFNGDGKQDIAACWYDRNSTGQVSHSGVHLLLSNGDGTFNTSEPSIPGLFGAMVVGDFNGDGRPDIAKANGYSIAENVTLLMNKSPVAASTVGMVDPASLTWYLRNSNSPGAPDTPPFPYGLGGWKPVVGDWNGDGQATVGAFDPASGTWYLRNSNSPGAPDITPFPYGLGGWIPLAGDWSGTGHSGIGLFDPSTATWYLRNSDNAGAPDFTPFQYGLPVWVPVVGDWNGDGVTTIGVIDPTTMTWYLRNSNGAGASDYTPFAYGLPNWQAVVGDWTNSGHTGIGVVDPNGNWYIRSSASAGAPDVAPIPYGLGNWIAVAGPWGPLPMPAFGAASMSQAPNVGSVSAQELAGAVAAALGPTSATWVGPAGAGRLTSAVSRDGSQTSGPMAEWLPQSGRRIDALDQVFAALVGG
jgi:hypothetical protein